MHYFTTTFLLFQAYKKQTTYNKPSYVAEFGIGDEVVCSYCTFYDVLN